MLPLCLSKPRPHPARHQRGSVIILVLGTILLVATLATKFIAQTGTELVLAAKNSEQSALRREAYSAMEVTLAVLADFVAADGALFSGSQACFDRGPGGDPPCRDPWSRPQARGMITAR